MTRVRTIFSGFLVRMNDGIKLHLVVRLKHLFATMEVSDHGRKYTSVQAREHLVVIVLIDVAVHRKIKCNEGALLIRSN